MKLVSYQTPSAPGGLAGVWTTDGRVKPVHELLGLTNPVRMPDVLTDWSHFFSALHQALGDSEPNGGLEPHEARILAPVAAPPSILCIGLNYRDHAAETNLSIPDEPVVFLKKSSAVIGPGAHITHPGEEALLDYEAELAIVIGSACRAVPVERALDYVAGYTIVNDVSARAWQQRSPQWSMAKSFDTFCPMGPALVTTDEIREPESLDIQCSLNGTPVQKSNTAQMIFGCAELISYLSSVMTLVPGDVIATGTPAGVGFARQPPVLMSAGDVVSVQIEGIGVLENSVVAPAC